jgi:hypothetical protein
MKAGNYLVKAVILIFFIIHTGSSMPNTVHANQSGRKNSLLFFNKGNSGNNTTDLLTKVEKDIRSQPKFLVSKMMGTNDMTNSVKLQSVFHSKQII